MRNFIWSLFVLFLSISCFAQDDGKQHQPLPYQSKGIKSQYDKYLNHAVDLVKYLPRNYKTDGTVDYTSYLQTGINENNIVIMPNFPVLINDSGLKLKNNQVVLFNASSLLKLVPSHKETYNMLEIHRVENVKVFYPRLIGDIKTHEGKGGEWGMGMAIRSSKNIQIYNPNIIDCWGDGIYVGYLRVNNTFYDESENIEIYNGYINNNGRNGISVVAVKGIKIYHCLLANNKRTFPKSGIDIEPGPKLTQGVELVNNVTYKNGARGVDLFFRTIAKTNRNLVSAKIINHKDIGSPIGIRIAGYKKANNLNVVQGNIEIINPVFKDNRLKTIDIEDDQRYTPKITIKNYKGGQNLKKVTTGVGGGNRIKIVR